MSRSMNHTVGAMHPVLFFVVVYGISLFLAFFICTTVYNNMGTAREVAADHEIEYAIAQADVQTHHP